MTVRSYDMMIDTEGLYSLSASYSLHHLRRKMLMLQDYLSQYEKAIASGDDKTAKRIESELSSVGMDAASLKSLVGWKGGRS